MADIRPRAPVHAPDRTPVRTADYGDEIALANARAERAEQRADKAHERADAALALADRSLAQLADAAARAGRTEAEIADERVRADALRQQLLRADARSDELRTERDQAQERADELQAGQELMMEMHARALAEAAEQLSRVREAAEGLRQAAAERKARGLLARLRAAGRGE